MPPKHEGHSKDCNDEPSECHQLFPRTKPIGCCTRGRVTVMGFGGFIGFGSGGLAKVQRRIGR